jgi:NAD(P)-dependent dehydrogenase (short-subunit alcohol dehydrogenase family)
VAPCGVLPADHAVQRIEAQGRKALGIVCDILHKEEVHNAVDRVVQTWGGVDILVNNAAILGDSRKPLEHLTIDEWDQIMDTNLRGPFLMTQAVWPHMVQQGGGKIVFLGRLGQPEDMAEVVVFLASQASNFITGNIIDLNGEILMV